MLGKAHQILRKYWNYQDFRPGQEPVIQSVMEGRDTLALLPTGAGKSLCYQVPALACEGMTLVVSPLIALMKDQVDHLRQCGVQAEAIYSGMDHRDIDRILDNAVLGGVKLLYFSPERLQTDLAEARIRRMQVNLIAVDEAHCISQWGYDFRPAYLGIARLREWHPDVPVLALTATAIPEVVQDIQEKLAFRGGRVIRTTFLRPNLGFMVEDRSDKERAMEEAIRECGGCAIVYVRSRRKTEEYARYLCDRGIQAEAFHAGLPPELRSARQEGWQSGRFPVMIATNAFGMGIDKPDVRLVAHMDLPDSLEAYYQEAGRAGRDGKPSVALLLAGAADMNRLQQQFEVQFPALTQVRQVYRALGSALQVPYGSGEGESYDLDVQTFSRQFQIPAHTVLASLRILEEAGWINVSESVYRPATVWIRSSPQVLHRTGQPGSASEELLTALQRTYQGIHQMPVPVREQDLARLTGRQYQEIVRLLTHLDQTGILRYVPRKDKPQLTFRTARMDADNLTFDLALLDFRKERARERIRAIRRYMEAQVCRQHVFMAYFGEEPGGPCGRCDRCLAADAVGQERGMKRKALVARLDQLFRQGSGLDTTRLRQHFTHEEWPMVRDILQAWSDEGMIRESKGQILYAG
ncbi:MAG: RecQ family ATP-dependent DNA helicase [Saprospiraceae bacterium]|nr:RecQ family ATP-dependent DNA helicase [Saprospiraceae bacterium]